MPEPVTLTTADRPHDLQLLKQHVLARYNILGEYVTLWLPAYATALAGRATQVFFNSAGQLKEKVRAVPEGRKLFIDESWNRIFINYGNKLAAATPVQDDKITHVYWFIMHTRDGIDRVHMTCDTRYDTFEDIARKYPKRYREIMSQALDASPGETVVDRQRGIIYDPKMETNLIYSTEFRNSIPGGGRDSQRKKHKVRLEDIATAGMREIQEETGVQLDKTDFASAPTYFTVETTVYAAVLITDEAALRFDAASSVRQSQFLNSAKGDILDSQGHRIPLLSEQAGSSWVTWSELMRSARTNQPLSIMQGLRPQLLRGALRILLRNFGAALKRSFDRKSLMAAGAEARLKK